MTFAPGMDDVFKRYGEPPNGNGKAPPGLGEWNASDDVDKPPPREWLVGNSFCRGFVSSLIAGGGVGKTALRTLQAISFVTGRQLTGEYIFKPGRALLVSLEDNPTELRRRVLAARLHYNIEVSDLDGLFLSAPGAAAGKLMSVDRKGNAVNGRMAENIEASIVRNSIDLLVLDPFVKAHSIPENDNSGMDEVVQLVTDLAIKYNIAVDVPHHVSKGTPDPGNADRARGASASVNAARLVYTLAPMNSEEATTYNISEEDRRGYVRLDRAKLNVARTTGVATWFKLVGVRLDNGNETYPAGDDVQTVELWKPPSTWAGLEREFIAAILNRIEVGLGDGNFYSNAPNAGDRSVWRVVQDLGPQGDDRKTEPQCRQVINAWLDSGLLVPFRYENPKTRKEVGGLKVDPDKRPDKQPRD